jgi:hypothetical protein
MMRNVVLAIVLLAIAVSASGCLAGPWSCKNAVGDWGAEVYGWDTYLGTLNYYTIEPIGEVLGATLDIAFVNPYWWLCHDVWEGTGTTYVHENAGSGDKD